MIVTGPVEDEIALKVYPSELPAAQFTLCRLHAGREELTRRILRRGQGGSWPQPGDPLLGLPATRLQQIAEDAWTSTLKITALDAVRIDTDSQTVAQAADAVLAHTGYLA